LHCCLLTQLYSIDRESFYWEKNNTEQILLVKETLDMVLMRVKRVALKVTMSLLMSLNTTISTPPARLNHVEDLLPRYDLYLIDVVGVVHDGIDGMNEAITSINNLCALKDKQVIFLSNNPRPGHKTHAKLVDLGLAEMCSVFTSGDATRHLLLTHYQSRKIYHLGAERNDEILHGLELETVPAIENSDLILLTAFLEEDESVEKHQAELDYIISHKPEVICANPDIHAAYGQTLRKCAGYMAQYLEQQGVQITYIGKPNPLIFELLFDTYALGAPLKDRAIMIGDTLETDIAGAAAFSIASCLVLTGNTNRDVQRTAHDIDSYLNQTRIKPTYISDQLAW
jgi:HAD-superfamily class IIA hydrolase, TIGR01459